MRKTLAASVALASVMAAAGCTDPEHSLWGEGPGGGARVNSAGPAQMLTATNEVFTTRRLATLVETAATQTGIATAQLVTEKTSDDGKDAVAALDQALMKFSAVPYQVASDKKANVQNQLRDARNLIQDQLISASNNRCNVYKTHIRRLSSNSGFFLGGLATAAGAAGAIVTGTASQALAGGASALSGVNAEFQKDFFNGLVTSVVIPGIDRQRADLRNNIAMNSCKGITDYPLTMAIAEAIRYHGACSADIGIAASGQAVARSTPDSLSTVLAATQKIRQISDAATTLTDAQAAALAGSAAQAAAARDGLKDQLAARQKELAAATDTTAKTALTAQVAKLQRQVLAATKHASGLEAIKAAKTARVSDLSIAENQPGAKWEDPSPKIPLVGDNLTVPSCAPLDSNGQQIATK